MKEKIDKLLDGFYSVIPPKILQIFSIEEFDFLISGQNSIDLEDWRRNTIYKGHYNDHHKVKYPNIVNQGILEDIGRA